MNQSPLRRIILLASFLGLFSFTIEAAAQNDFFSNLDLQMDNTSTSERDWQLLGWLTEKVAYGYESPGAGFSRQDAGFNKVETSLFAQLDWQLSGNLGFRVSAKSYHDLVYHLDDDTPWSQAERRKLRNRYEVRDLYMESQLTDDLYLRVGNQIVAWGMAEYLRITDVINIEDQLTLGQQDLEDFRLQVPALLLGFRSGDWLLESVLTYRAGSDDLAPAGNEFDQLSDLRSAGLLIDRHAPGDHREYFFRASTHYSRGDFQLVAGDFNHNQLTPAGIQTLADASTLIHLDQQRIQMLGTAANFVSGSWLLFGETGMHFNRPVVPDNRNAVLTSANWQERTQWLTAIGAEYNGFSNTTLTLELDTLRILNHSDTRTASRNQASLGTRIYWSGWNDRLEILGVWNHLFDGRGYVTRMSLDYTVSDQLSIGAMWVDYSADDNSILYNFRNNDVIQLQLRYSFQY